jgi:hypothetical protein
MSSETSTPYTPASTSTTVARNETVLLVDEIKKYDMAKLIEYLQGPDLGLNEDDEKILRKEKIKGQDFFDLTEERLRSVGLGLGPAMRLVKFAKECKDKKKRAFSSYRSLKEVLAKYGIDGNGIGTIRQFPPVSLLSTT